jgi:tryptophanyl-tRNA synthetase
MSTTTSNTLKRKISDINTDDEVDEEIKRKRLNGGEDNNEEIELYKYHKLLPDHLKPDIKLEISEYKHEIFNKLQSFYQLLTTSLVPLTADQWQMFEHILTLLRR